jgi:putative transposase
MHLGTRRILHYDIHTHPTTSWVRRVLKLSLRKAIQSELPVKYLISDNDSLFGKRIARFLRKVTIKHKKTSIRSPWQNGYAERFVKTCKEEWLSVYLPRARWPVGSAKVAAEVDTSLGFFNQRTHIGLNKETPVPSIIEKPPDSKLVATPVLNGLYHTYSYKKVA